MHYSVKRYTSILAFSIKMSIILSIFISNLFILPELRLIIPVFFTFYKVLFYFDILMHVFNHALADTPGNEN